MADHLAAIAGRFVLTVNDVPETRALFGRFIIQAADVSYHLGKIDKDKRFGELIVTN